MHTWSAYGLAVVIVALVAAIGIRFLLAPTVAATGYGVPARPGGDPAYLTIKGLRDSTLALLGAALLAFTTPEAAGWYMLIGAIIPVGDMLIVLRHHGPKATAYGVHLATAAVLLLDAVLLLTL
ncbi:DUF4267 domain-containing protein [Symbioplanes lichenis]|uniref:DUF4267 domain-containing protein n=1 Tax=Symbioplanes lichenis TaxID=1629072 RepID=UPI00273980DE|nr:DUF4267 domain-containing protein [Actinoplanes lichenis]